MTRAVRGYLSIWFALFAVAGAIAAAVSEGRLLVFAATILLLTGLAHSVLGERFILARLLRRSDLPRLLGSEALTRRTIRFAWHLTSVAWWGAAALLLASADGAISARDVARILSIVFAASAAISAVVARGRHLSWAAFGAVAIATWIAS